MSDKTVKSEGTSELLTSLRISYTVQFIQMIAFFLVAELDFIWGVKWGKGDLERVLSLDC